MSRKDVKKSYSATEIEEAFNEDNFGSEKSIKLVQDLFDKVAEKGKLTQAESDCLCRFLHKSKQHGPDKINVQDFDEVCSGYIFKKLYLSYHGNLDGRLPAYRIGDYSMELIPSEDKKNDVRKLQTFFLHWEQVVSKFKHTEALLNDLASETNIELKQLDKLNDKVNWSLQELAEKRKATILHSKYIYLTAKEFFEENRSDFVIAQFGTHEIEINTRSLIHIMFRHYAGAIKQFDIQSSFHFDTTINYKKLPNELKFILESLGQNSEISIQSIRFIPLKINDKIYSIWTDKATKYPKGKGKVEYTRLETFYPTEFKDELDKIANEYLEIKVNDQLSGFAKKTVTNSTTHKLLTYFIASVWIVNGLLCKVLNLVPRHRQIVASILGEEYSKPLTILIGLSEIGMAIWILSRFKTRLNANTQILIIATMNVLEFTLVPNLLLWGEANAIFAFMFILLIYYNEFHLNKKLGQKP